MKETIKIGISSCLLGEKVRFDGGHKLDRFLRDILGRYVEYVPVCPEVECGLPVPREAMRLEGNPEHPELVTSRTGRDLTEQMSNWAGKRVRSLERENLCGFIFKSRSPSSGMERVKVFDDRGMPHKVGVGLFARAFMEHFPLLPVEEDGRLNDPVLRENFIERVFTLKRWRESAGANQSRRMLIEFHTKHKLLLMAHSQQKLRELGKLVADVKQMPLQNAYGSYLEILMPTLKLKATVKKHVNVLMHITGYFKRNLTSDEKKEVLEIIDRYHHNLVPLVVPLTLLNHYIRKFDRQYLQQQVYLNPHPVELMLRNHV